MKYTYFSELRGRRILLTQSNILFHSALELFQFTVADSANLQRVYDEATPDDVTAVILSENAFDFLMCGDVDAFKKWLKAELIRGNYSHIQLKDLKNKS